MTPDVIEVRVLRPYLIEVTFADGLSGCVDVGPEMYGPVFEPLHDPDYFEQARVDAEIGTVVWPNGADLSPEFLYAAAASSSISPSPAEARGTPRI